MEGLKLEYPHKNVRKIVIELEEELPLDMFNTQSIKDLALTLFSPHTSYTGWKITEGVGFQGSKIPTYYVYIEGVDAPDE